MSCTDNEATQLQQWNAGGAQPFSDPTAGPLVPKRVQKFYESPRPHPWRPALGYENVEITPLPSQPTTNALMDPCTVPYGMSTEPLRFPNLVTGFERNPSHAARAALYNRYTPHEWVQSQLSNFNEADTNRNYAERLRSDALRIMSKLEKLTGKSYGGPKDANIGEGIPKPRQTEEKTAAAQRDSGRRLGERITDATFWRNEVHTELEKMVGETNLLQDTRRAVEKAIQDCEAPLHIAQECLYHREHRQGIDLVHDQAEQCLLKEVENLKNCQMKLNNLRQKVLEQLRLNRGSQHELETDVKSKESAIGIDSSCHQMGNFTRGINFFGGIEKYDALVSVPETWSEHSNRILMRSQQERSKSVQMRTDADNLINACANDIWNSWNDSNGSLSRRSTETLEAKNKIQMNLHKVQQEIFDVEKTIELIRKAIMDKSNPLKVAHTRLEARAHRQGIELCKDTAQDRLVREVGELGDTIESLHRKLQEAEAQLQHLLMTRSNLEADLNVKVNSLFIDREKCLGMRRSFPITATVKY